MRPIKLGKKNSKAPAAADVPEGRREVEVEVLKTEYRGTGFVKMLALAREGYTLWGSVPSSLHLIDDGETSRGLTRGDKIRFTATLQRSDKDSKFGFFSRPAKASLVKSRRRRSSS